ncbi:glycine--tRNA ligase subunit beta [Candidatus Nitrosacidococcus sp. I8]|uniref:glycine--tRNA ligase subunit beta n=1 Tax=Candidatus Nitrosacidococcus sp. I8 TaxID=2942908 RepID=UPI002227E74E|nr:glycine--tRNA ligase subunit beta [Candidatus Nitrosacidococcus sp. I8]CAH9016923.1 Glycine--tRNA ligase beta subunit [Candidatus Nitrosacidococcus sp. I8]
MIEVRDLLVEIGTEELPPKSLLKFSEELASALGKKLQEAKLSYEEIKNYGSPRRLAVLVKNLAVSQPDWILERRGPVLAAAFKNNQPTPAAQGFAQSCGVAVNDLEQLKNEKGTWLIYRKSQKGSATQALFPEIIAESLKALSMPKPMCWGDLEIEFIRPVHWLVLLFGSEVIPTTLFNITADKNTRGHRFHNPKPLALHYPSEYEDVLAFQGKVIADFAKRRAMIITQVEVIAQSLNGIPLIAESLLNEVTALVEWPVALWGKFDSTFLSLPREALIATMEGNQKYFPVEDKNHNLLPYFITVANIEGQNPAMIIAGNERVIRPRLADADFFYTTDCKTPLISRRDQLKKITFQEKLGSIFEKTERISHLAATITQETSSNEDWAKRSGLLSKCDLVTQMVMEFPELQGTMGYYYALHDREPESVAIALKEQYLPRFAGDNLPQTPTGCALSLADRLDSLIGFFGIDILPSGDKDPYGLRRAALGIIRVMIENKLNLDLIYLLKVSYQSYQGILIKNETTVDQIYEYILERLRSYYLDIGFTNDVIESVLVLKLNNLLDIHQRLEAVTQFVKLPEAQALSEANKRVRNILRKSEEGIPKQVDSQWLKEKAEQDLAQHIFNLDQRITPLLKNREYSLALQELANLHQPINQFFDSIMVMVEDSTLRINRLALLNQMQILFLKIADISQLQI